LIGSTVVVVVVVKVMLAGSLYGWQWHSLSADTNTLLSEPLCSETPSTFLKPGFQTVFWLTQLFVHVHNNMVEKFFSAFVPSVVIKEQWPAVKHKGFSVLLKDTSTCIYGRAGIEPAPSWLRDDHSSLWATAGSAKWHHVSQRCVTAGFPLHPWVRPLGRTASTSDAGRGHMTCLTHSQVRACGDLYSCWHFAQRNAFAQYNLVWPPVAPDS